MLNNLIGEPNHKGRLSKKEKTTRFKNFKSKSFD